MLMEGHLTAVIFSLILPLFAFVCYWKLSGYAGEKFTPNELEITSC